MQDDLRECVMFFKKNNGYKRIFESLRSKYVSLGRLGGNVIINEPTENEISAVRGLLQKDFANQKEIRISVAQIEKALAKTKFSGLSLNEIVVSYFGGKIETKQNVKIYNEIKWIDFWTKILPHLNHLLEEWLRLALEKKVTPYKFLLKQYRDNPGELKQMLLNISKVFDRQLKQLIRLAVLAAEVSGDPHYFDDKRDAGRFLVYALCYKYSFSGPLNAEAKNELFYKAGIIRDDISNNCTSYGLLATMLNGDPHSGFSEFSKHMEPITASLANLWGVNSVYPVSADVKKVYIVENPTVFSVIVDAAKAVKKDISIICSNGQFRLATLILLDKISENELTMYYAGDFDPTGLLMAERMKERYGEKLVLWKYSDSDYQDALSDIVIKDTELKKLDRIKEPGLLGISNSIRRAVRAGYQERIINNYLKDLGL